MGTPGQQIFLPSTNNHIETSMVTASPSASTKPARVITLNREESNGLLNAYGDFTGLTDKEYEVIISALSGNIVATAPIFYGVGDGELRNIVAKDLASQKIVVVCKSVGTDTERAEITFGGYKYESILDGTPGNSIYFTIDNSGLTFTAQDYSTHKDLNIGDTGLTGSEWDYDTKYLNNSLIPADAHRIAFGIDRVNIHLQYKDLVDGVETYYFIRPITEFVPKGSRIYFVTGGRTITITDGTSTSETYYNIVTQADLWEAIKDNSSMLRPYDTSINDLRTIDSPQVYELLERSDAHYKQPYGSGSDYATQLKGFNALLQQISIESTVSTSLVKAQCVDNSVVGQEKFDVTDSVEGDLGTATVNQLFAASNGKLQFLIPQKLPVDYDTRPRGNFHHNFLPSAGSTAELCLALQLGIKAKSQTMRLEYQAINQGTDLCPDVDFDEGLLGLPGEVDTEGGDDVGYTVQDLVSWTEVQYRRMRDRIAENREVISYGYYAERERQMGRRAFDTAVRPYFCEFKKLAKRIYELPDPELGQDGNAATLVSIRDAYKALVNTSSIVILGTGTLTWDGSDWSPTASPEISATTGIYRYTLDTLADPNGRTAAPADSSTQFEYKRMIITGYEYLGSHLNRFSYDIDDFDTVWDSVLTYEATYGVKKNLADDICEQDILGTSQGNFRWVFIEASKPYEPAYTDVPYYSSYIDEDGDLINTQEFSLNIHDSSGTGFQEGDIIEITIEQAEIEKTYAIDDIIYLPLIASRTFSLTGGVDGDDTYVFRVEGRDSDDNVINTFRNYSLSRTSPQTYTDNDADPDLSFFIEEKDQEFVLDDRWEFWLEYYKYQIRSREVGGSWGAWAAAANVTENLISIGDGLSLLFEFGAYPSYALNDKWKILAYQDNKIANMLTTIKRVRYKGTGDITIDLGSVQTIDDFILDLHTITSDVYLEIANVADFSVTVHDEVLSNTTTFYKHFATPLSARYIRISSNDSTQFTNVEIGYLFAGTKTQLTLDANVTPRHRYIVTRQTAKETYTRFNYRQEGFTVDFPEFAVNDDFNTLLSLIEYSKENNDLPFYFVPNIGHTTPAAYRVIVEIDDYSSIVMPIDLTATSEANHLYRINVPLIGPVYS